jgi:primosomal protein N' (replication factor Y)
MALPMTRARLLVMNSALPVLDYRVPHGMEVEHGSVVIAPLGPRQVMGIVWEPERLPGEEVGDNRLRPLLSVLPVPPLPAPLRRLIEWTADYYCASLASVARMALSSTAALAGRADDDRISAGAQCRTAQTPDPATRRGMETLQGMQGTLRELAEAASVTEGVLRGMVNGGMMETVRVDLDRPIPPTRPLINPTCPKGSRPPPIRWSMRCVVKPLPPSSSTA